MHAHPGNAQPLLFPHCGKQQRVTTCPARERGNVVRPLEMNRVDGGGLDKMKHVYSGGSVNCRCPDFLGINYSELVWRELITFYQFSGPDFVTAHFGLEYLANR